MNELSFHYLLPNNVQTITLLQLPDKNKMNQRITQQLFLETCF